MVESQMLEQIDAHSRQWNRGSPFCRAQNFNFIIIIFPGCHPRRSCPWHGWEGRHIPTGMVHAHTHTHTCTPAHKLHSEYRNTHTHTHTHTHTRSFDTNIGRDRQKSAIHFCIRQGGGMMCGWKYRHSEYLLRPNCMANHTHLISSLSSSTIHTDSWESHHGVSHTAELFFSWVDLVNSVHLRRDIDKRVKSHNSNQVCQREKKKSPYIFQLVLKQDCVVVVLNAHYVNVMSSVWVQPRNQSPATPFNFMSKNKKHRK